MTADTKAYYENNANPFKVQLPQQLSTTAPIAVNYDGHALRFFAESVNTATAQVTQPADAATEARQLQQELAAASSAEERAAIQNERTMVAPKHRSSVGYASVAPNTDLLYNVSGYELKESILLRHMPTAAVSYVFRFEYTGLRAELQANNSVIFYDGDEAVFTVASPYMFDNDEGYSRDLTVTLQTTATGCRYVLTPDYAWLTAPERVYPVTVDPTVSTTQNSAYIHDNGVQESNPTTNYMAYDRMYLGTGNNYEEGRIYFKLTQWPTIGNYMINLATLRLSYYPQANWQTAYDTTFEVSLVSTAWDTNTITWNNRPGNYSDSISSTHIPDARNQIVGNEEYDVTDWVISHYNNPSTDYGICMEVELPAETINRACYISSDYYADTSLRPIINIVYNSYDAILLALSERNDNGMLIRRDEYFSEVESYVSTYRGGTSFDRFNTSFSTVSTINKMQHTNLFFIHTHGNPTEFSLGGGKSINMYNLSGVDLSNLDCALLLTCYTGLGGYTPANIQNNTPVNIVEKMVCCGAETVIGFSDITYSDDCNSFARQFAKLTMEDGLSVEAAIDEIDVDDFFVNMKNITVIGGNENQTLN